MPSTLTVSFDLLSSSGGANIPGPAFVGQPVQMVPQFVSGRAADGTRYTYQLNATALWEWELTFQDLPFADKQDIDQFFRLNARGGSNPFTYVHTNGQSYVARFVQDELPWIRSNEQLWSVAIRLEVTTEPK